MSKKCLLWRYSRNITRTRKYVQKDDFCKKIAPEIQKTISMVCETIF